MVFGLGSNKFGFHCTDQQKREIDLVMERLNSRNPRLNDETYLESLRAETVEFCGDETPHNTVARALFYIMYSQGDVPFAELIDRTPSGIYTVVHDKLEETRQHRAEPDGPAVARIIEERLSAKTPNKGLNK